MEVSYQHARPSKAKGSISPGSPFFETMLSLQVEIRCPTTSKNLHITECSNSSMWIPLLLFPLYITSARVSVPIRIFREESHANSNQAPKFPILLAVPVVSLRQRNNIQRNCIVIISIYHSVCYIIKNGTACIQAKMNVPFIYMVCLY